MDLGPHLMHVDGDVVLVRLWGPFEIDHMVAFCGVAEQVLAEQGRLFTISDLTDGATFPPSSRRYAMDWSHKNKVTGSVLFGASRGAHVALTLLIRATALVTRRQMPFAVVDTEAEARSWIEEQRRRVISEAR